MLKSLQQHPHAVTKLTSHRLASIATYNAGYDAMIIAVVAARCMLTTQTTLFQNTDCTCSETKVSVL